MYIVTHNKHWNTVRTADGIVVGQKEEEEGIKEPRSGNPTSGLSIKDGNIVLVGDFLTLDF